MRTPSIFCMLVLACLGFVKPAEAQEVEFNWASGIGGSADDFGISITVDASGNVYTTGYFQGTVDFDPGVGIANFTSAGDYDIFIQKMSSNGNFLWTKAMGATGADRGEGIEVDSAGNVYCTGSFSGTVDFDTGAGTANLNSVGLTDIFVQKLDSDGNLVWANKTGGTNNDNGQSLTLDAAKNVYITGRFVGIVDFDPGAGTTVLTSAGSTDAFVQKLDSDGNLIWAKSIKGPNFDLGYDIEVDALENVYTTGSFTATADLDPGAGVSNHTSSGGLAIFVQKLDVNGNFVWAKSIDGTATDYGYGITVDNSGNVYTTGSFTGTADFDSGSGATIITGAGGFEHFVQKLSSDGNIIWIKAMGGAIWEFGYDIAVDASENVYTTGIFTGTADFDPGAGVTTLTSAGAYDMFVHKLDSMGNFAWVKGIGGTGSDYGSGIAVDASGSVYTAGFFQGTVDFDSGIDTSNLTNAGGYDGFVLKLAEPAPPSVPTTNAWIISVLVLIMLATGMIVSRKMFNIRNESIHLHDCQLDE